MYAVKSTCTPLLFSIISNMYEYGQLIARALVVCLARAVIAVFAHDVVLPVTIPLLAVSSSFPIQYS